MSTNKNAQFTPGPWYAANMGNDFQGLVVEEQTGKNIAVAYDKRDVHILAAAPAMYEALQFVREFYQTHFDVMPVAFQTVDNICTTALSQAEGRHA